MSRGALTCGWAAIFLAGLTLLLLAVAGPGHKGGLLSLNAAFLLLTVAALGAVLALVLGTVAALWNRRKGSAGLALASLLAAVVGLALTVNFTGWFLAGRDVPMIHDITTDTLDPPQFVELMALRAGAPNPAEYPGEETAQQQRQAYPDLMPIRVRAEKDAVFSAAVRVAMELGWDIVAQAPGEGRIEAVDTTRYFGFRDDVVIRMRRENGEVVVDVRSKSRVGLSDVGTNAARIRAFRERLLEQV
jgi:uncharacterized protein (DUF1499 family)